MAATSPHPAERARPGAQAWTVLIILCFVYVLNFLDRQLLSILAKPIQDSLHLTDGQLGRVGGLYFALFYCLISVPVGWVADKGNRTHILSLACALWSLATTACGLSANYGQLVVARMAVGIGEAGGVPPSYAIISDYFGRGTRGAALGIYNLGPPLGQALGVAIGASVAVAFGWRQSFILVGCVGLLAALLVLVVVREPPRGGLDHPRPADQGAKATSFTSTVGMFFSHPALVLAALGSAATQIITYGGGNFATLLLMREKGMTLSQVAVWYALVIGVFMSGGIFLSGRIVDRFTRHSKIAYALIPAFALVAAAPLYLGFILAPSWPLALVMLAGPTALNYFFLSSAVALVQDEVRPDQRVVCGALLLLVMNLIGLGAGPTFVGAASDWFHAHHHAHALQLAFLSLMPFYALAILIFLGLAQVLRREDALSKRNG